MTDCATTGNGLGNAERMLEVEPSWINTIGAGKPWRLNSYSSGDLSIDYSQ